MKKLIWLAVSLFALFIGAAHAAPFFTADVVVGATSCGITVDAQPKVTVAVKTTAISAARPTGVYCEYDVAGLTPGAHTITATAIAVADPVYGTQESSASPPLTTTKPAAPAVPQNPKLSATAGVEPTVAITAWKQDTAGSSINVAAALVAHDVAIAWAVSDSAVTSMTALSGFSAWTVVQNTKDGQTLAMAIKTDCSGSEGTITLAANNNIIGGILGISGLDNTTQPDVAIVTANDNIGSASPFVLAAPSLTPATNGALIVALFGSDITAGSASAPSVVFTNSGTALSWTNQAVSNDGGFRQATIGTATQATAAAVAVTGTGTLGGATAGPSIIVVALRPGAAASAVFTKNITVAQAINRASRF